MKKFSIIILLLFLCVFMSCKKTDNFLLIRDFKINDTLENVENKTANIVLIYGQSNATGCSLFDYLETNNYEYLDTIKNINNVYINFVTENYSNSSDNTFINSIVGCGARKDMFGPEVGISLNNYLNSSEDLFIIKYSYGGTTLDDQWLDGSYGRGELYNGSIKFTIANLEYLISKGYTLNILGICWMQGENDACSIKQANRYLKNTKKLVSFYRKDLNKYSKDIRWVDACIDKDVWPKASIVNETKLSLVNEIDNYYCIDTNSLGLTTKNEPTGEADLAHYDSLSQVLLGRKFYDELVK